MVFNRHCSWTRHCEIDVFGNWPNFFQNWPNFSDVLAGNFFGTWQHWRALVTVSIHYTAEESPTKWRLSVVSECCWELRSSPRQPPPVTEPWLYTDCWRGFKPLVPSDKRFNHSKVWCTFISSSTSTVYAVQVQVLYSTLLQSCIYCIYCIYRYLPIDAIDAIR